MNKLTRFECVFDLEKWVDSVIVDWIKSSDIKIENLDSKAFSKFFTVPCVNRQDDAFDVISSFMKVSNIKDDIYFFVKKVIGDGVTMDNAVDKANGLYREAFKYYYRESPVYYNYLWKIHHKN